MSEDVSDQMNEHLVFITGESATGKSASLQHIKNQERWMYLNCEAGKRLPFRNKFDSYTITDPYEVYDAIKAASESADYDGVIIDTITFLMEMFETRYIVGSSDGQKAWGEYQQFFKRLMQEYVAGSSKSFIFLAHTRTDYDEKALMNRTAVPIKGALKNNGLEAYFSTVVSTKKIELKNLGEIDEALLHTTPQDETLGFKYVFQTQLTKSTLGERIRSPMGMFDPHQTYMDNDAQLLLDHLSAYYS